MLIGAALLGIGLRQRRSTEDASTAGEDMQSGPGIGIKETADDAHTARERDDVLHQDETNPRGVTGEPDVETVTEPDEGDIQFTVEGEEPRSKPSLDDEVRTDPRSDKSDESVEIDLSETSMADEASEATGPTPEQAEPAQVEDTEPDHSPPEDTSHMEADVPDDETGVSTDDGADDDSTAVIDTVVEEDEAESDLDDAPDTDDDAA